MIHAAHGDSCGDGSCRWCYVFLRLLMCIPAKGPGKCDFSYFGRNSMMRLETRRMYRIR